MLLIYTLLVLLLSVVVVPLTFLLDRPTPAARNGWRERTGRVPRLPETASPRLWVQAVSVGEVQLASQLLGELRGQGAGLEALLTSTTRGGRSLARSLALPRTKVAAFPVDLPAWVDEALDRARPDALVLVETEIWPNLITRCAARGIPVVLANGRISERSFPRYRMMGSFVSSILGRIDRFLMRSEEDADRIRGLGAPASRVEVTGDLKWDLPSPDVTAEAMREALGFSPTAPIWVAGSTFEGEEAAVLDAFLELKKELPELGLVLAPRHPQRFESVAKNLSARGVSFSRRSDLASKGRDVLLLDTLGELRRAYGAGSVCFVGGSLVPRGGQNLLEPAAAGRPVLFGPRTENFSEAASALLQCGGGFRVASGPDLLGATRKLLRDAPAREAAGRLSASLVAANRGATQKTASRILSLLEHRES